MARLRMQFLEPLTMETCILPPAGSLVEIVVRFCAAAPTRSAASVRGRRPCLRGALAHGRRSHCRDAPLIEATDGTNLDAAPTQRPLVATGSYGRRRVWFMPQHSPD